MDDATVKPATLGATLVPLLAIAVFINYVDRGNLATAAPLIKEQLRMSSTQIGLLLSAFFWTYVPAQLLAGWLAERVNPYRTLAIGLALWSIATAVSGLASGFITFIALRMLLGIGESAAFPCTAKLLALNLPSTRLGSANGLIAAGLALGPAFGTFAGGLLMARIGWRSVFLLFGLLSLSWLIPWHAATRQASARINQQPRGRLPSFAMISKRMEIWGASLGHFCANYSFYFVISWLPLYLVKQRGLSLSLMAEIGGLIYFVYAASSLLTGLLTDRLIRAGNSASRVRRTCVVAAQVIVAGCLVAAASGNAAVSVISLFFAGAAFGLHAPNLYAIGQTLAGPRAAGKWMGIQNCIGNIAGIVAPIITGFVVDRTGQFYWAFIIAAAVAMTGTIGWGLMIRKVALIDWSDSRPADPIPTAARKP